MKKIKFIWQPYFQSAPFRTRFYISTLLMIIALISYRKFLDFAEARPGVVLNDPVLLLFNPIDLTWLIFGVIYLCLMIGIFSLLKYPEKLLLSFQTYTLIVVVRIIAMYLVPFEAPEKLIVLNDPFVELFGSGDSLTKDLFFSGHTTTLFLLFLVTESKTLKYIFLLCTIVVGVSIILQHVHYLIDIFAAPFFAYTCFRIISSINLYKLNPSN